jgi:flagellar basal-body rod protein FlgB
MDLSQIPLFAAMAKRLQWLTDRQNVIAQNVTNANTPGYTGQDLKPLDFGKVLKGETADLQLAATDPQHIKTPQGAEAGSPDAKRIDSGKPISLEEQMMMLSETATDFNFTTALYQKQIALLKDAIGHS